MLFLSECHFCMEEIMLDSKDAAQLFTSQSIQRIAEGDYSLLKTIAVSYLGMGLHSLKVADVFDLAFRKISIDYKNEYIYKNIIANKFFLKKHAYSMATISFEFRVGQHKADCVIFNGQSICYEIKTEFDNLKRLPEQIAEYSRVFDRVNIICANVHLENIMALVPPNIGIIELKQNGILKEIRKASKIESEVEARLLIQSLRRDEYVYIAQKISNSIISVNNMEIFEHCAKIMESCDSKRLRKLFRESIKKHRKLDFTSLDYIPESLISSILSYRIKSSSKTSLYEAMNNYIIKENLCIYH